MMNCTIQCCLNCSNRAVGCHSTCERYQAEKAEWNNIRQEERKLQRQEYARMKTIMEAKARMTRG